MHCFSTINSHEFSQRDNVTLNKQRFVKTKRPQFEKKTKSIQQKAPYDTNHYIYGELSYEKKINQNREKLEKNKITNTDDSRLYCKSVSPCRNNTSSESIREKKGHRDLKP